MKKKKMNRCDWIENRARQTTFVQARVDVFAAAAERVEAAPECAKANPGLLPWASIPAADPL